MSQSVSVSEYTRDKLEKLIEETPASGPKRSLGLIAFVACLGSLLFGYDTGVISGALPYMYLPHAASGLSLTSTEEGWIGGFLCIGAAVGAAVAGYMSDKYGRRHNITLLSIVFFIGAAGCALSPNIWILYVFRFILGFAVGGASGTVPVFLGETAPKRVRGTLVAVDQLMIVFGQFLAFSLNAVIAQMQGGPGVNVEGGQHILWDDAKGTWDATATTVQGMLVESGNGSTWRWMLIIASLPAIALWIGIRLMPESSRWYVANLRIPEAIGALKRIRNEEKDGAIIDELDEMLEIQRKEANQEKWGFSQIWGTKWTRHLLIIGVLLGFADQFTGINTAMYYTPKILTAAGFPTEVAIQLNVISGGLSFIGSAVGLWLVTKFARRHVGIYQESFIVVSLGALAYVFWKFILPFEDADGNLSGAPSWAPVLVLVIICLFVFAKQSGTVTWILVAELFPAKARGTSMGIAVCCLWLANGLVSIIFPILMESLGGAGTYLVFALINVASLCLYLFVVPETKYDSLEELEVKFEKQYS